MDFTERVSRRLKLRDLRFLAAVAQSGSMAKAATQLNISQPAVSKAIAELEHTLGVRLLDRMPQGVEPTPYGRALLKHGIAIFDELRQGAKEIEFLADPAAGEVRVGSAEVYLAGLLTAIIERLGRRYPRIVFHVGQATAATQEFRELRERRVDLVIGRIAEPFVQDDLNAEILYQERVYVVAGKRSKWARRKRIALAELMNEAWIFTPPDTLPNTLLEEEFRARGLKMPPARIYTLSSHLRNSLVPTGQYLTVLPGSFLRYAALRSAYKVLPIDFPMRPRPIGVVTVKNRTLNPAVELFLECARAVARPLSIAPNSRR